MRGCPESRGHVDGVGGGQLELDAADLQADGDGGEEGLLALLAELKDGREDVVLARVLLHGSRRLLLLLLLGRVVGVVGGGGHVHLGKKGKV